MTARPNMRRRGLSGWQLRNHHLQPLPILPESPTRWHLMLYGMGIEEKDLGRVLKGNGAERARIVEWVRKHVDNSYVPTKVLMRLGMKSRFEGF